MPSRLHPLSPGGRTDELHALEQLLERLRTEKALPALPLPPDDAPAPPRPWNETDEGAP